MAVVTMAARTTAVRTRPCARLDQGRAARGSRRAAKGRRGAAAADGRASEMSAKDRLAAKLGTDQAAGGFAAAGAADYAAGGGPGRRGRDVGRLPRLGRPAGP